MLVGRAGFWFCARVLGVVWVGFCASLWMIFWPCVKCGLLVFVVVARAGWACCVLWVLVFAVL